MIAIYWNLFMLTVRDPAQAARKILGVRPGRRALWLALALAIVLNTIVFHLANIVVPPAGPAMPFMASPGLLVIMLASVLCLTVLALTWLGRALGGSGALEDILVLVTWLQFMRLGVQAAAFVLMLITPALASLGVFAAGVYGIYILTHFLNEAHGFGSLGKSFVMLVFGVLGMVLGLSMILSIITVTATGGAGHV